MANKSLVCIRQLTAYWQPATEFDDTALAKGHLNRAHEFRNPMRRVQLGARVSFCHLSDTRFAKPETPVLPESR